MIGAADLAKARSTVTQICGAEGIVIDLAVEDLGFGDRSVGTVAMFHMDHAVSGLRFARARGAPYLGISLSVSEVAPANHTHAPGMVDERIPSFTTAAKS
jgi:hypothetical protein